MNLQKTYQPAKYESDIYQLWEKSGAFGLQRGGSNAKPFVVALPPPNANASLHTGHALDFQLKDLIGRWRRLQGRPTLLIPGADHAGFETWAVYEKHLNAKGQSRFDFSREELYGQVYEFVMANKAVMEQQIRKLGVSCDWNRLTFTLDEKIVRRSYQTFKQMWERDLIYRGKRLVNYCTAHGTGFADYEVTYKETDGQLWFIRYPAADGEGLVIATTRPETLLGDVAVAVHPSDERYAELHGRHLQLPLTGREIPVICDSRINPQFGSGAVKITPGHDFLDFDIGREAGLEVIEVIGKDGKVNEQVPEEFRSLTVQEARQAVLRRLEEQNLLVKTEGYRHQVGHCYKCGTVLEPLMSDQWFVRMQPLAEKAIKAITAGKIKFHPAAKGEELVTYLRQLQDWNISRQIAWGIPIPVFQSEDDEDDWIFDERVEREKLEIDGRTYRRDPDVFDTWWSSGQWAFATVNWPDEPDLYPNSLMETGTEIMRPWVSRMILLSLFVTGEIPFETVYLHGMVQDDRGVKMSKSKGNVINPMDLIDSYGADAVRIGLCSQLMPGQPQKLSGAKIAASRNFCNKLWNISRFIEGISRGDRNQKSIRSADMSLETPADHWIWQRFLKTKAAVNKKLAAYQVAPAWDAIYGFVWNDLADWYLEATKERPNRKSLSNLLENTLRLVHPFAPFLTEAIYQELLADDNRPLLISNAWADEELIRPEAIHEEEAEAFNQIKNLVSDVRRMLPPALVWRSQLLLQHSDLTTEDLNRLRQPLEYAASLGQFCRSLTGVSKVSLVKEAANEGLPIGRQQDYKAWIILDKDLLKQHADKLEKDLEHDRKRALSLQKRLSNQAYLENAPSHLVGESQTQLAELEASLKSLKADIDNLRRSI